MLHLSLLSYVVCLFFFHHSSCIYCLTPHFFPSTWLFLQSCPILSLNFILFASCNTRRHLIKSAYQSVIFFLKIIFFSLFQLFDHIADCIGKFVVEHDLQNHQLPLGFTFSFPCQQEGLAKARLSKWTKGFRCEGVVGKDICQLLQEALQRRTVSRNFI